MRTPNQSQLSSLMMSPPTPGQAHTKVDEIPARPGIRQAAPLNRERSDAPPVSSPSKDCSSYPSRPPEQGGLKRKFRIAEIDARRAIEDRCGYIVQDANILLQANCPNVDLIVFAPAAPIYVQVKSSERPAGKDHVVVEGSPWTEGQLFRDQPIFNRHGDYQATLVMIVDRQKTGTTEFYIAPPAKLEPLLRSKALEHAAKPKRDGSPRAISFRKELPRDLLAPWRNAWHLFGTTQG
jgi:hypothetical protein